MSASAATGTISFDPDAIKVPRPVWWCRASVLSVVIFVALVLNNSEVLFQSRLDEKDDYAANSLQVLKAKRFQETLGNYSRFGFHHPGPAFLYVYAWGEILCSDTTHLVASPFHGQLLALCALSAFFFSATLAVIARQIGSARRWFLGIALLLAAWHFGAVGKFFDFVPGRPGFFCLWPPCVLVLPFLCFLVTVASVSGGAGRDLPLMVLAGCFLGHGHVAMPLFVVPLALAGYGGLLLQSRMVRSQSGKWPWQRFPRQHWFALGLLFLFAIPIVVDLLTAHPNNLQRIIRHLENGPGERKSLLQSALYFLHFGAYTAYPNRNSIPAFETFDWSGTIAFFGNHWRAYTLWLAVMILCFVLLCSLQDQRRRFARRLCLVLIAATALSLAWGCLQEGTMFYYNALFNFAIYYGLLLVFATALALWAEERLSNPTPNGAAPFARTWKSRIATAGPVVIGLAAMIAFVGEARRFRAIPSDQNEQRFFAAAVQQALRIDPVQPKFLNFEWQAGGQTARLALYLERIGCRWVVREDWPLLFGEDRILKEGRTDQPAPTVSSSFWRVVLHSTAPGTAADPATTVLPLTSEFDLVIHPGK